MQRRGLQSAENNYELTIIDLQTILTIILTFSLVCIDS